MLITSITFHLNEYLYNVFIFYYYEQFLNDNFANL